MTLTVLSRSSAVGSSRLASAMRCKTGRRPLQTSQWINSSSKRQPRQQATNTTQRTSGSRRQKATLASEHLHHLHHQQQQSSFAPRRSFWEVLETILRKPRTLPIPRWITPRHYTITLSECLGHSSFILVATSYAVDDFLKLRIIAVAGSTAMLFFTYWHPYGRVLWLPFKWNVLFILINSYRIGKIYLDRYFAERLPPDLIGIRDHNFFLMDPVDFAKLMRLATVTEYKKGDLISRQGEANRYVRVVLDGELRVLRDGKLNYMLSEANFVSEAGLHAGLLLPGKVESACTVVADTDARLLKWDRTELTDLMRRDINVRRSFKATLNWDIVRKLKAQRTLLATGRIDDPEGWTVRRNDQTRHRYMAILHNILQHPQELDTSRKELNKYRQIHQIDDETHNAALRHLGWTPEEFEAGRKEGQEWDEEDDDVKRDWRWYLQDFVLRIIG